MFKEDIAKVKSIVKKSTTATNVFDALEVLYFRVSNKGEKELDEKYDEEKVLKLKPDYSITKEYKDNTQVIIDFIVFGKSQELVIIFSGFINFKQDTMCFYIKRS